MNKTILYWKTIKRLLLLYKYQKKKIFIALILIFISTITEILGPIIISSFLKKTLIYKSLNYKIIIKLIISFLTVQIFSVIINYIQNIQFSKISTKIIYDLRKKIMKSILYKSINFFDKKPIGSIITIINNDTESIKDFYETFISSIFQSTVLLSIILFSMFLLEWRMALLSSILIPIISLILFIYQKYSKSIVESIKNSISQINNIFNETINGILVIQQFRQEKRFFKKMFKINTMFYESKIKILKLDGILLRPLFNLIISLILSGIIILCTLYPIGLFEVSLLYTFITYLGRLNEPLIIIANQQSLLQQSLISANRVFDIIDSEKKKYGSDQESLKTGIININNVSFSYSPNKKLILKKINLIIPNKSFVAFVGKTGSGKSTLAKLLMSQYSINSGKIYIDNRPIESLSKKVLRESIFIVQQEPTILYDNLENNISLGRNIDTKEMKKIIKKFELESIINNNNSNRSINLGQQGNNLSQGQKQLIEISRILISKPKILIFDEATANIDTESEQKIQKLLSVINKKSTIIVIAHRLSTVINANKIFVMNNGVIIEEGTHEELIKKNRYYFKMYSKQNL